MVELATLLNSYNVTFVVGDEVAGFICKIKLDTQVSVKCKPTEQKK